MNPGASRGCQNKRCCVTMWTVSPWLDTPLEVKEHVMRFVSVPQLALLGGTSRWHYSTAKLQVERWVSRLFQDWHLPPVTMLLMREEKVTFSGSAILSLMDRAFPPRDFDAYVGRGRLAKVEEFLARHTDYVKIVQDDFDDFDSSDEESDGETDDESYRGLDAGKCFRRL